MNCIVVPIYKEFGKLSDEELISLNQLFKVLGKHQIIFFGPNRIQWGDYLEHAKKENIQLQIKKFNNYYFESINSYNQLLISLGFYKEFKKWKYVLVYQLDAFIFRDELRYWCGLGYDYIGAPWSGTHSYEGKPLVGVGNGGFSLRNLRSCLKLLKGLRVIEMLEEYENFNWKGILPKLPAIIKRILATNTPSKFEINYSFQEDVFWCISAPNRLNNFRSNVFILQFLTKYFVKKTFKIAPEKIASKFSFETRVGELYELNNKKLPFGCHAWEKYEPEFWKGIIPMTKLVK